jgi:nucleoside-diphosphate-sugar epimerase
MGNETVLVTGATGFVGGRLVERLVLGTDCRVKAMVHRFSGPGLARSARLPVRFVLADLLDLESLIEAAEGCDVIVHCAYGSSGSKSQRRETTVAGTENVLKAALQTGVRKVIHLSSSAVHGRDPKSPVIDESAPFTKDRDVYTVSKIEAEKIVWQYHREHGLPVVVFRPTLIYGPYGRMWTVRIVEEIQSGATLVNGGSGAANLIYVDNLIDAISLAMNKDSGDGEAFTLVDDERLTWYDVYKSYADMMGSHPPLQSLSAEEIEAMKKANEPSVFKSWVLTPLLMVPEMVRCSLRSPEIQDRMEEIPWMAFATKLVPRHIKDRIKGKDESRGTAPADTPRSSHIRLPGRDMVELYASHSRFSNEKVKKVLGYRQRIPFDEAMILTRSWLRYQRLIP